jgi:hypothetical protein
MCGIGHFAPLPDTGPVGTPAGWNSRWVPLLPVALWLIGASCGVPNPVFT